MARLTIGAAEAEFRRYRALAQAAAEQLPWAQWRISLDPEINSIAVVMKHVAGNLRSRWTDVLTTDGEKPWRNREAEFADRDIPTSKLMKEVDELTYRVKEIVSNLTDEQFNGLYPLNDGKKWKYTSERLFQLLGHLNYHLGQINYHRRLLDQPVSLPDAVNQLDHPNKLATSKK